MTDTKFFIPATVAGYILLRKFQDVRLKSIKYREMCDKMNLRFWTRCRIFKDVINRIGHCYDTKYISCVFHRDILTFCSSAPSSRQRRFFTLLMAGRSFYGRIMFVWVQKLQGLKVINSRRLREVYRELRISKFREIFDIKLYFFEVSHYRLRGIGLREKNSKCIVLYIYAE